MDGYFHLRLGSLLHWFAAQGIGLKLFCSIDSRGVIAYDGKLVFSLKQKQKLFSFFLSRLNFLSSYINKSEFFFAWRKNQWGNNNLNRDILLNIIACLWAWSATRNHFFLRKLINHLGNKREFYYLLLSYDVIIFLCMKY